MKKQTYRTYQCPGCDEGAERPDGWKGVFCSDECRSDSATVRALRKEMETGRLTAGTLAMRTTWEEMLWFNLDYSTGLPPRSAALYERVFFPEPLYPADRAEWSDTWSSWKVRRTVSEPYEAYDYSG